jgi:hypothetical protein
MVPTLLAMLVGVGVPYFVARKLAERNPGWVGVAVSLALACVAGVVALFTLAFAAGFLLEHYMNLFDVRLDTGAWPKRLERGIWGVLPGAVGGIVHGRRRAAALGGQPRP